MKKLLIIAALAAGIGTVSAQDTPPSRSKSGLAANRASTSTANSNTPTPASTTITPNYSPGNGQRVGNKKINTAPATGATRASRSSSTTKAAKQGGATGSGNIETMSKNSNAKPGSRI